VPPVFIKEQLPEGDAHLQEERRLFYVALTRAKEGVVLTWAKDYGGSTERKPSRFLAEVKLPIGPSPKSKSEKVAVVEPEEKKINYELPKVFSFSQLAAYDACPRQYFYNFVAKVPTKGNKYFSFGKTIHSTLQKFYQLIIDRVRGGQADLFSAPAGKNKKIDYPTEKDLLKFYEECWIDDWYESAAQKEKYKAEGLKLLHTYYDKFKDRWLVPLYLEKPFTIKVENYSIRGVFDRVDADNDQWEIIDYKTGQPKDKLTFDDKRQLLLYQIAASEVFKVVVKNLTYYYLTNNEPQSFVGTDQEIKQVKDWAVAVIRQIQAQDFTATPGYVCNTCDFNKICPFAKVTNLPR